MPTLGRVALALAVAAALGVAAATALLADRERSEVERRVLFSAGVGGPGLQVVDVDGSSPRATLTRPRLGRDHAPAWSPDGSRVAFVRSTESLSLVWIVNADGSAARALGNGTAPTWSPDGTRLAYERAGNVVVHSVESRAVRVLGRGRAPSWSPDGRLIAFLKRHDDSGHRQGSTSLHVAGSDGSGDRLLVDGRVAGGNLREHYEHVVWAPDGTRIALAVYAEEVDEEEGYVFESTEYTRVVELDGGTSMIAVESSDGLDWSPDGRSLATAWDAALSVVGVDTGARERVAVASEAVVAPSWSPDGRRIAFLGCRGGAEAIRCDVEDVAADGGDPRHVARLDVDASWLAVREGLAVGPLWQPASRS